MPRAISTCPTALSATLSPGKYRDITLEPHSTLKLNGGVYNVRNIWVKTDGHLLFSAASDVRILGALQGDNGSEIGPAANTGVTAKDIIIYVGSTDQQSPFSTAVNINPKTVLSANVYAENGTILLNQADHCHRGVLRQEGRRRQQLHGHIRAVAGVQRRAAIVYGVVQIIGARRK